ncbi:hypothetical protein ACN6K5_000904 [Streptomyces violaceoruber]|uniref:hypothetical protein n=1 Tax=Streptomyces violaceoruber TaxID=1935 RepID=UPI00403D23BA
MTEQQTPERLTDSEAEDILARIERQDRERRERRDSIDRAFNSREARAIVEFIREDGNLPGYDLRELASKAGGILELVAMVDEDGDPDPEKLVPFIDGVFNETAKTEFAGGMTMTKRPNNRPYQPRKKPAVRFDTDGLTVRDAERLLEQARQAEASSWSNRRR